MMSEDTREEKLKLQREAHIGDNVRSMYNHSGFKEFEAILKDLYGEYVDRLIKGENAEARAGIRNLEEIVDRLDVKIILGEEASKRLGERKFNREDTV